MSKVPGVLLKEEPDGCVELGWGRETNFGLIRRETD